MKTPATEQTPLEIAIDRHMGGKRGIWDITPEGDAEIEQAALEQIGAGKGTFKMRGMLSPRQSAVCRALDHLSGRGLIAFAGREKRGYSRFTLTPKGQRELVT